MSLYKKITLLILTLLLSAVSLPVMRVKAAVGTEQQLERVESGNDIDYFYATEGLEKFLVYCFNSDLHWPSGGVGLTNLYTPDDFNHLSAETKNKIYRIFYAGYPHNNAGLYIEGTSSLPSIELIRKGLQTDAGLLAVFPELTGVNLTYFGDGTGTIEDFNSADALAYIGVCQKIFDWEITGTAAEREVLKNLRINYPRFYSLASAYIYSWMADDISSLPVYYASMLPPSGLYLSADDAHLATQLAVWIILHQQNVPNNSKGLEHFLTEDSLVKKLVDFANGTQPIPNPENSFIAMEDYKNSFNNKEHLLNAAGIDVGTAGGIRFIQNPFDGKYYSEKLHFSNSVGHETYASPFEIAVMDGSTELSKMITYGKDEFVLVSDALPSGAKVKLHSDNYWPSPIYQYVAKSDSVNGTNEYQEMSGVYYKKVELGFEVSAYVYNGSLTVKKLVDPAHKTTAEGKNFWFRANLKICDVYGNQLSGMLKYKKYKLDASGNINTMIPAVTGSVYNYGNTGTSYNTEFFMGADEAVVFEGLPYGTEYSVTEYALSEMGTSTGNWIPAYTVNGAAGNSGVVTDGLANTVVTTNGYKYDAISLDVAITKTLNERALPHNPVEFAADKFGFIIWPDTPVSPMPAGSVYNAERHLYEYTVKNTASSGGTAIFPLTTLSFDTPGTYKYTIAEQDVTLKDVSKDQTHYHLIVEVTDSAGTLVKNVTLAHEVASHDPIGSAVTVTGTAEVSFANIYDNTRIDKAIHVRKAIQNNSSDTLFSRAGFVYNVVPAASEVAPSVPYLNFSGTTSSSISITTGASGEAITPVLEFTDSWFTTADTDGNNVVSFSYNITEVNGGSTINGLTYDNQTAVATVVITKDGTDYSAVINYTYTGGTSTEGAVFTNTYNASGDFYLNVKKTITSLITYNPAGNTFEFKINDDFERNGDKSGYTLTSPNVTMVYNGTNFVADALSNKIHFVKAGDYQFELSEVSGSISGMQYDTNKWIVRVEVVDDGLGNLTATAKYFSEHDPMTEKTVAEFVNRYVYILSVPVQLKKSLTGRSLHDADTFSIIATHSEGVGIDPLDPANICTSHTNFMHQIMMPLNSVNNFTLSIPEVARIFNEGTYFLHFREENNTSSPIVNDPAAYVMKVVVEQVGNTLQFASGYPEFYKVADGATWSSAVLLGTNVFEFENKTTSLTVKKTVTEMNPGEVYGFYLTLTDALDVPYANEVLLATVEGIHSSIVTDATGKAYFELKKDETLKIVDLKDGTKYTLEEVNTPDCNTEIKVYEDSTEVDSVTVKSINNSLEAGVIEEVLIHNIKKPELPTPPDYGDHVVDTGDNSMTSAYIAMAGLSALGFCVAQILIKRLEKENY